jgi:hypothetical protein
MRQSPDDISPTRGIMRVLLPYEERGVLEETDWLFIKTCIHDIEVCQARKCLECEERRLIRNI